MKEEKFLRNWATLKPLILQKWTKLHEFDLEGVQPVFDEIVMIIHSNYPDTPKKSIISELNNLSQQILKPL